jgi:hypothetical protein
VRLQTLSALSQQPQWTNRRTAQLFDQCQHPLPYAFLSCAGKPNLRQLLGEDPYFLVRVEDGFKQPVVKLRISRLAKLIGNPELIEEYRTPADGEDASSRCGGQPGLARASIQHAHITACAA